MQGPVADALTHAGQLAMLRRLAGSPTRGENFYVAAIADRPGQLRPARAGKALLVRAACCLPAPASLLALSLIQNCPTQPRHSRARAPLCARPADKLLPCGKLHNSRNNL